MLGRVAADSSHHSISSSLLLSRPFILLCPHSLHSCRGKWLLSLLSSSLFLHHAIALSISHVRTLFILHRGKWLLGLLIIQSTSSFVLSSYEVRIYSAAIMIQSTSSFLLSSYEVRILSALLMHAAYLNCFPHFIYEK